MDVIMIKLTAKQGYVLCNGSTYTREVILGINADKNIWQEVTITEAISIVGGEISSSLIDYETRVVELIRQRYTVDQELAILRQRDVKVDEYQAYYDYCEECKQIAKDAQTI